MALGAPFHCCRLTHWMCLAASTPLGLVLERQSSQAKDDFVESKKVSIVFRAELTAGDERAARLSPKTRTSPESARGLGNPYLVVYEGLLLRGLRFANSRTRPNLPHGTSCCGIFATLGEYFSPITLLGDFPVRMSQLEHVGGVRMGVETILLIVILAFAAGFVLDRLAVRRGRFDAAKSKKEQ